MATTKKKISLAKTKILASFEYKSKYQARKISKVLFRIIIHSASADASTDLSADMPEDGFFKLKILLKHSRTF